MAQEDNVYDVVSLGTGDTSGLKAVGDIDLVVENGEILAEKRTINGNEVTIDEFSTFYNMSDDERIENYGIPEDTLIASTKLVQDVFDDNVFYEEDKDGNQTGKIVIFEDPPSTSEDGSGTDSISGTSESDNTTITEPSNDTRIPTQLELEEGYTQDTLKTQVQQINGYKAYIQTADPQDKISQENIKKLKGKYPQLKDVVSKPLTSESSEEEIKSTTDIRDGNAGNGKSDSDATGKKVVQADPCKPTFLDEMQADLENFFSLVTGPGNAILNLPASIKGVSDMISKSMNGMINQMAGSLQDELAGTINQAMNKLANKVRSKFKKLPQSMIIKLIKKAQTPAIGPIEKIFGALGCVGTKIGGMIGGMVTDLLGQAINDVVNAGRCVAQQVVGALMNKVVNIMDSVTGPLLGPIEKILGKIGNVKNMIFGAIGTGHAIFNVVKGFLSCESEGATCKSGTSNVWVNGNGAQKTPTKNEGMESFKNIVEGTALKNAAQEKFGSEDGKQSEFEKEYGKWKLFGDKTEKVKVDESEKTKLLSQISPSNLSVFESLTEGQRTRILNSNIGVNTEGINVTERIKFELRQYELSLKASDEPVYETKVIEEGKTLSEFSEVKSDDKWNECNSGNIFKCGLPKVEIFGGGGIGGAADVIMGRYIPKINNTDIFDDVKTVGSIVGVDFTDHGSGYTSEPIVTFSDNCNQGYGAYGKATIDQNPSSPTYGEITSIVIINPGENYPADDEELPLYIGGVVIENPGSDYEPTDTIDDFDITVEDGEITNVDIVNQRPYNDLPELNINTSTGFGAQIRPLMTKVKPSQTEVLQVIDCVGKV